MAKEIKKIIQVDTSEAERSIEGLTEKVKEFKKELTDTGKVTLEYTEKQKKHKEAIKENEEEEQKQIQTVKDLKKEINDLKDSLVPLTKGSDEWNSISKELIEKQTKLTDITRAAKEGVDAEAGSYNELKIRLREALEEYHKMSAGDARNAKADEVRELREELKRLDEATSQYGRNVGNYENAIRNVLNEYTSQRAELNALRVELEQLEPGTEAYNTAFMRAAEITHNLQEQQEMLKYSSTDLGDQLSNIRGIASNMAAGFSAVNAAMGLFGNESSDVQKAMLKVQQAMALVQGLQGIDGFLKRTKGLSNALTKWITQSKKVTVQTTAQATATNAAATATVAETTATEAATVAQNGLNAAMAANPVGLLITALAILITYWEKFFNWLNKVTGGMLNFLKSSKKLAKEQAELTDDIIKDNEAKLGSDWKYTEEGQKYYQEYFDSLLKSYKKDSEKFKEAQREKWEYDRELLEHQKKAAEDAKKEEEERRKDAAAAAKTYAEKMKEIDANYAKISQTNYKEVYKEFRNEVDSFIKYYQKEIEKIGDKSLTNAFNLIRKNNKDILEESLTDTELFVKETQVILSSLDFWDVQSLVQEVAKKGGIYFSEFGDLMRPNKYKEAFSKIGEAGGLSLGAALRLRMQKEMDDLKNLFEEKLDYIVKFSVEDKSRQINDEIINLFKKSIRPTLAQQLDELQNDIDKKVVKLDFEVGTGMKLDDYLNGNYSYVDQMSKEFERAQVLYDGAKSKIEKQIDYYKRIADFAFGNMENSEAYEEAISNLEKLNTQLLQLKSDYYIQQGQIRKKYYDKDLKAIQTQTDAEIRLAEKKYNEQITIQDMFSGVWPEREQAVADEIYQIKANSLQKQLELYEKQLFEQNLTADERIETEKMVASITAQIEEEELRHTMETNQRKIDSFQAWYSAAQECVGGIADLIGGLADYYEADMEAQLKAGEITEEQADKQFENIKGMRITEAVINTLAGSIGAFLQACATYPPPAGPIIGSISAAAVAAAGAAQIAKIKSSTRNGSSSSNSAIATPQIQPYEPQYVQNTTGASDVDNLRNALYEQPIYVRVSDIDSAQNGRRVRTNETSF